MTGKGVRPPRTADMSAEMTAAAKETKTTETMTPNKSLPGTPVMTGTPETLASDGTLVSEDGNQPESLVTTETAGT